MHETESITTTQRPTAPAQNTATTNGIAPISLATTTTIKGVTSNKSKIGARDPRKS